MTSLKVIELVSGKVKNLFQWSDSLGDQGKFDMKFKIRLAFRP